MRTIRTAILGQGRSGYAIHAEWLKKDRERYQVVAVADRREEQTRDAAREFEARTYGDYRELLADPALDVELVVNALPSRLHPQATIEALARGCHVISEKPAARSLADFDRVAAAANQAGRLWLPFQNSRFNPIFGKAQEVIASGKLGKIVHIRLCWSGFGRRWDWQTLQHAWGGNLLNTGPHPLDMAVVLLGDAEPQVFARLLSENPFGDADNLSLVTLYGPGLPVVEIVLSSFMSYGMNDILQASGTQGCLSGGATKAVWRYFDPATAPAHAPATTWVQDRNYCAEKLDWIEEEWSVEPGYDSFGDMSRQFYDNAYAVLTENAPRVVALAQVRRQVRILEECLRQNPLPQKYAIGR